MVLKKVDVVVIGSGMGSLSTACMLSDSGKKILILEQNYLLGGSSSSYWRKGFAFESGATTLVGLDDDQPLKYLLDKFKISISKNRLELPMIVKLRNGTKINKFQDINKWIEEAESVFGKKNQREFWLLCFEISQFVWSVSLKQNRFPISSFSDLIHAIKNVDFQQLKFAPYALMSMEKLLKRFGLVENQDFVDYVNAQLLITAQNIIQEVNVLFGATALCYTNYSNYYVDGGLINLVTPIAEYIQNKGAEIHLREEVKKIERFENGYLVNSDKAIYQTEFVISGIPLNNTLKLFDSNKLSYLKKKLMPSEMLNSAFQMGIGFKSESKFDAIHYQIHLQKPLSFIDAKTIFVSLSHEDDISRTDIVGTRVASISTHWANPAKEINFDKSVVESEIIAALEENGLLKREDIIYHHSSTPSSWQKWTGREYGFVGGYPQYMKIKPWQMVDSRLDKYKAYLVGDSAYPGQGIPGVVLGGIIAAQKMKDDWGL